MKSIVSLFLFFAFLSFAQAGWVSSTTYNDANCTNLNIIMVYETDVCVTQFAGGFTCSIEESGYINLQTCYSGCNASCFNTTLKVNQCSSDSGASISYDYYDSFPIKLANLNPVAIVVQFKGSQCDGPINAVSIQQTDYYATCNSNPAQGEYCSVPPFLCPNNSC